MASTSLPDIHSHPMIRKLESVFTLSDDEKGAILNLPMQVVDIRPDQDIVREGDSPSRSCLVLDGFACTYKITGEGRRQIVAFNIVGDIPDLQSLHLRMLDNSIGTLSPCTVGFIPHDALRTLCERHPRIASALWRSTLVDAAIFREWMTSIGRREAYSRIAHLLCEMLVRLNAVEKAEGHTCDLPITQAEFGDALGLSTVHVNRIFQDLRADGLIRTKGTQLTVPDWDRLQEAGEFDRSYLHLERQNFRL
ncbi:Crp/Fnr family transcriptional regulator [Microvirga lenta]|uniref:Crp/Fnr family transcriptional regulator n=1 Tax=Microvirga lenta TaxID=2881337 RepID=UPI001CFD72D7|nr:Crp/Fnr family transcriptional regulator [Microvirga lenta]MCB5174580.1 Crp/Fnr family transcriptional regulator [Microvirga lenta]